MSGARYQLPRKTCRHCGEQCLADEWRCWACGSLLAEPDASTILTPRAVRRGGGRFLPGLAAAALLFLGIGIGYFLGRPTGEAFRDPVPASPVTPLIPGPSPTLPALGPPRSLPPPPTMGTGPQASSMGTNWGLPPSPARPWPPRVMATPGTRSTLTVVPLRPPKTARHPAPAGPWGASLPLGQGRTPPPVQTPDTRHATASREHAAVVVQNAAVVPLELEMNGPVAQSVRVAPRSRISFSLPSGAYRIELRGGDRHESRGTVDLRAGDRYTILFDASGNRPDGP